MATEYCTHEELIRYIKSVLDILVEKCLKNGVDPSANDNEAIIEACQKHGYEIIELLLEDPRVDPSARDNEALITACVGRNFPVVRLLLKDIRVDPSARNNEAIKNF